MNVFRPAALCVLLSVSSVPVLGADITSFVASGTGRVVARPDVVYVSIDFTSEGKTPEEAVKLDAQTVARVTKALTGAGIEDRDLQTANYIIDDVQGPDGCGQHYDNQPYVTCSLEGYEIRDSMTVRIRDLAHYGQVLEAAIKAGLTDISNITLAVSDARSYEQQAYAAALLAAKQKAELTAKTLGFKLGAIIDVGANFQTTYDQPKPATLADGVVTYDGGGDADLGVMIRPGELTFSRDASITYQIVQEH